MEGLLRSWGKVVGGMWNLRDKLKLEVTREGREHCVVCVDDGYDWDVDKVRACGDSSGDNTLELGMKRSSAVE